MPFPTSPHAPLSLAIRSPNHNPATNTLDMNANNQTTLSVEIPLVLFALATVLLRLYARLGVKRKVAVDDLLIVVGTVRLCLERALGVEMKSRTLMD
jgi:hypothetical protein